MDTATGIALLGVAVAVIFGVVGMRAVRKRQMRQQQSAKEGSTAIQSGRDTKVGGER
jgi:hypothetical protein